MSFKYNIYFELGIYSELKLKNEIFIIEHQTPKSVFRTLLPPHMN